MRPDAYPGSILVRDRRSVVGPVRRPILPGRGARCRRIGVLGAAVLDWLKENRLDSALAEVGRLLSDMALPCDHGSFACRALTRDLLWRLPRACARRRKSIAEGEPWLKRIRRRRPRRSPGSSRAEPVPLCRPKVRNRRSMGIMGVILPGAHRRLRWQRRRDFRTCALSSWPKERKRSRCRRPSSVPRRSWRVRQRASRPVPVQDTFDAGTQQWVGRVNQRTVIGTRSTVGSPSPAPARPR